VVGPQPWLGLGYRRRTHLEVNVLYMPGRVLPPKPLLLGWGFSFQVTALNPCL